MLQDSLHIDTVSHAAHAVDTAQTLATDITGVAAVHAAVRAAADTVQATPEVTGLTVDSLMSYADCGYFVGDSLLHAEQPARQWGFPLTATPFRLSHNGWSYPVLLLCALLLCGILRRMKGKVRDLLRSFFFPIPGKKDDPTAEDPVGLATRLMAVMLLTISATLATFVFTQSDVSYYPFPETPYLLLAVFAVAWLLFFLMKRLAFGFVNWIFFRSEKIFTWTRANTLLLTVESLLMLFLALAAVFLPVRSDGLMMATLVVLAFVKILLLFKTYQIFFPKLYGTLHLFVYFCTLEMMPLLVMYILLQQTAWVFMLKI